LKRIVYDYLGNDSDHDSDLRRIDHNYKAADSDIIQSLTVTVLRSDEFISTNEQTNFTLSNVPTANTNLYVFRNGIRLRSSFVDLDSDLIIYNADSDVNAPDLLNGDEIIIDYVINI
jgi:hypothetical protein